MSHVATEWTMSTTAASMSAEAGPGGRGRGCAPAATGLSTVQRSRGACKQALAEGGVGAWRSNARLNDAPDSWPARAHPTATLSDHGVPAAAAPRAMSETFSFATPTAMRQAARCGALLSRPTLEAPLCQRTHMRCKSDMCTAAVLSLSLSPPLARDAAGSRGTRSLCSVRTLRRHQVLDDAGRRDLGSDSASGGSTADNSVVWCEPSFDPRASDTNRTGQKPPAFPVFRPSRPSRCVAPGQRRNDSQRA
eukprot:355906-Chlamydomonas_euryale.AAC.5